MTDYLDDDARYFRVTTMLIKLVAMVIACVILFFSQAGFIFFSVAMLPTVVVSFIDRKEHKCASATICTFNLIGILPYISQFWSSSSMEESTRTLSGDISTWVVIYGSALVGQVVYWTLPAAIAKLYVLKSKVDISMMSTKREKLCADWNIKTDSFENQSSKKV